MQRHMKKFRALIVDDEELARRALRSLLMDYQEIEIISEAEDVAEKYPEVFVEMKSLLKSEYAALLEESHVWERNWSIEASWELNFEFIFSKSHNLYIKAHNLNQIVVVCAILPGKIMLWFELIFNSLNISFRIQKPWRCPHFLFMNNQFVTSGHDEINARLLINIVMKWQMHLFY